MNMTKNVQHQLQNIIQATSRFWFSTIVVLLTTFTIWQGIASKNMNDKLLLAFIMTSVFGLVAQLIYERFFNKHWIQWSLYALSSILGALYYFYLSRQELFSYKIGVQATVLFFVLIIASIWIPTIQVDEDRFARNFIVYIKAFFTSFLYSLILTIGLLAIVGAFNLLIYPISGNVYSYLGTFVWSGFCPLYFLSLLPLFPTGTTEDESYQRASTISKFLAVLISYIIIPLLVAYTLILMLYILKSITGNFWQDNLLEPFLISYIISGWLTLILSQPLSTPFVTLFKKYFPLLLLFVSVLQGISSIVKWREFGLTDNRYFTLIFIFFSICSIVLYFKQTKNNWIPALFIGLSLLSIFPYIDAISVATRSQNKQIETTLKQNNMLKGQTLAPNGKIPKVEKRKIVESYNYLQKVDAWKSLSFLPKNVEENDNFVSLFGFSPYSLEESKAQDIQASFRLNIDKNSPLQLPITGSDMFFHIHMEEGKFESTSTSSLPFSYDQQNYQLVWKEEPGEHENNSQPLMLTLEQNNEAIADFDLSFLRTLLKTTTSYEVKTLSTDSLTFDIESEQANVKLLVTNLYVNDVDYITADFYLFLSIK
uniref:DUF4153 domain-containing protein n=1 Tax=Candidatus Enterococcus willemsii TaxID=1857215 RepID=UPI00403EFED9